MEWIIGLFILWVIGALSGGSSKDSTTIRNKNRADTNSEPLENLLKKLEIDVNAKPNKKTAQDSSNVAISSSNVRQKPNEEPPPYDEMPPWLQDEAYSDIESSFKKYGISSIWHITHKDNIKEILNSGILNNKTAYAIKKPTDISDHGVQRWRESDDPIYGRKLHNYVPTYINIRNPMLSVRRDIQHELCIIEISLSALSGNKFLFTDGNAAARNTHFYNTTNDLDKLPWDVLNASYWNDFPDGKRKRCSEVLIYRMIDPKHIIKLHCCSSAAVQYLSQFPVPVEISEELFFGKSSSSTTSAFSSFEVDFYDDIPF